MTKEEAKKILETHQKCQKAIGDRTCKYNLIGRCEPCAHFTSDEEFKEAEDMAIEALFAEPQEWISVKDRLPTENDEYYVSIRYECDDGTAFDDVTTCYFWAKEGVWNGSERMIGKILAWQPITEPSPYKGE